MLGLTEGMAGLGGTAGAGLGGTLGGLLGTVGDTLSAPRRYLLQALGLPESGTQALSQLGMDPDSLLTHGLGFAYDVATDPLTYLGGALGRLGGKAAGAAFGSNLEAKALARGPGFAGGIEKLGAPAGQASKLAEAIGQSPHAAQVLGEIPMGAELLPGSNNALAFRTPQGDVLRIGQEARANVPQMLQPTRSVRAGEFNVERLPMAQQVGDSRLFADSYKDLAGGIRSQGLHPADLHPGNLGLVDGRALAIDPGAIAAIPGGPALPMGPQLQARSRGGMTDWLLDQLGADQLVQNHLAQTASPATSSATSTYPLLDRLRRMTAVGRLQAG